MASSGLARVARRELLMSAALAVLTIGSAASAQQPIAMVPASPDPTDTPLCSTELQNGKLHGGMNGLECQVQVDTADATGRWFIVYVPSKYDDRTKSEPLVLDLHGHTGTAQGQRDESGQKEQAKQRGFVVVWPQAIRKQWNSRNELGLHWDDVGFLKMVIAKIEGMTDIDRTRVYVTGHSNGADMTQKMACKASGVVKAIAPVSYPLSDKSCNPTGDMPIVSFQGTLDTTVKFNDRQPNSLRIWSDINGCDTSQDPVKNKLGSGGSYVESYSGCGKAKLVVIDGAYHDAYTEQQIHPHGKEMPVPKENRVDVADYIWNNLFKDNASN